MAHRKLLHGVEKCLQCIHCNSVFSPLIGKLDNPQLGLELLTSCNPGMGDGKGKKGNFMLFDCLLLSRLWTRCFTCMPYNHHKGLMKSSVLDEEPEAQHLSNFASLTTIKWWS